MKKAMDLISKNKELRIMLGGEVLDEIEILANAIKT